MVYELDHKNRRLIPGSIKTFFFIIIIIIYNFFRKLPYTLWDARNILLDWFWGPVLRVKAAG